MATWKGNYLSFGGIQTLIQAALSSLPVCFDPYSKPQKRWYRNLNHCKENFLWKGRELNKPHLIKDVSRSQKNGELGIGGIANRNVALLGKWHWLFPKERHSLWASILRCKCGFSLNVWDFNQILPSSDHSPWKSIITSLPSILAFSRPLSTTYITFVLDRHLVWLSISSVSFLSVVQPFVKENKSHFRFCLYFSRVGYPPSKEP